MTAGRPIWAKDFSSVSGMSLDERFAYASDQNSVVSAFALDNGGNVWKQAALKNRQLTAPALLGARSPSATWTVTCTSCRAATAA